MTTDETKQILRLVCAAYPSQRQKMTARDLHAMLDVWSAALADIPFDDAQKAVARIVCSSKWMPSIAEFRAEVGEMHAGAVRKGGEAWGDVLKAVGRFGSGRSPTFDDPLVAYCVDSIGWRSICMSDETDPAPRARFIDLYDSLARDERKLAQLTPGGKIPPRLATQEPAQLGDIVVGLLPAQTTSGE